MKTPPALCLGAALLAASVVSLPAAELIPVADFARPPDLTNAKLAPDGHYMGYIFFYKGVMPQVSFLNLETNKAIRGAREEGKFFVALDFHWVSDQRVLAFTAEGGLAAVNRDGEGYQGFASFKRRAMGAGSARLLYASGLDPHRVLLESVPPATGKVIPLPDVVAIDTEAGTAKREVANSGNVRAWATDWEGNARYGLVLDELRAGLVYRERGATDWNVLADFGERADSFALLGPDADEKLLYLAKPDETGHGALYAYDFAAKSFGEPLFRRKDYDIITPGLGYAGASLSGALFSPKTHALLGVNFFDEGPHQYWFDPTMTALQQKIDSLLPGLSNFIVSMDQRENRLLILSWSDRHPGFYSLLDRATGKLTAIGQRMPWIKPGRMAPMFPIACTARDGLELHGYLTLPVGAPQKNLPLVMLVHGGPWARDTWGYDPIVQFLASRGYAVLQINYRGSTGYGQAFRDKGKQEIGGAIQDDITDALRWAIAKGFADPKRIAIMGASYGGYSALYALAKNPELYRCGVNVCGVTNWPDILEQQETEIDRDARAYWVDQIGDLKDEATRQRLSRVSPVNFAWEIAAPLLIVHGKMDQTVPLRQSKQLINALEKAGHHPQTIFFDWMGHGWPQSDDGVLFLKQLEEFLAKNLAPQ